MTVATWREAEAAVRQHAAGRRVLWGTGNRDYPGTVVAVSMDAWSGGRMGFDVFDVDDDGQKQHVLAVEIH